MKERNKSTEIVDMISELKCRWRAKKDEAVIRTHKS